MSNTGGPTRYRRPSTVPAITVAKSAPITTSPNTSTSCCTNGQLSHRRFGGRLTPVQGRRGFAGRPVVGVRGSVAASNLIASPCFVPRRSQAHTDTHENLAWPDACANHGTVLDGGLRPRNVHIGR